MRRNKWDAAKCAATALPFLFLAAYLAHAALPLPAFLLSERRYVALAKGAGAEALAAARGGAREAFALLPGRLLPLPPRGSPASAYEQAAALLPDRPSLEPAIADIEAGLPALRRARLVAGRLPAAGELLRLQGAASLAALPLALEVARDEASPLLLALSHRIAPNEERRAFELLFAPEARSRAAIEVEAGGTALWRGNGAELPADLVLRLSAPADRLAEGLRVRASEGGREESLRLDLGAESSEAPRVLVVSAKGADKRSFIERIYPAERATPEAAAAKDLHGYELVVVDGLPLGRLGGGLRESLLDVARRRTGSILFVADSPDFGKKGDDPELEALLPASLAPKSLKDLPDLAILILIDTSGSMFGDKLSLAKVTGLELLRNLKPSDRVGMLLFSDERRWVYDFVEAGGVSAAPVLEPLRAKGGTDLAAALSEGLDRASLQGLKDKHVVLVTDGVTKPADFQALADRARALGATISAMGVGDDADQALLQRLAYRGGGRYYPVASPDEVPALIFEDRKSAARPPFAQGRIGVLALNGERIATIGGMAQYSAAEPATVLFSNELGDPLFASREQGNRAVMLFASDLYGTYTSDFFARPEAAGAVKDRLDALFADRPLEASVAETGASVSVSVTSDFLASPRLLLTSAGEMALELPFHRAGPGSWSAEAVPPRAGRWTAAILDRGSSLASFPLPANTGLGGGDAEAAAAVSGWRPRGTRPFRSDALWLGLFFASSLACTIVLRLKR